MSTEEEKESWYYSNSTPLVSQMLPLLTPFQVKNWKNLFDNFSSTDAKIWLPCPIIHGSKTFVFTVTDNSMFNPSFVHSFKKGDYVFVDPDVNEKEENIFLVQLDNGELVLRQLLKESNGGKILKAINPNWPENSFELNQKMEICGTVIGKALP